MNSEIPNSDGVAVGGKKLKSIPQILHQGIISPTAVAVSSGSMEFMRKKRRIKFNTDSRLSCGVSVLLEFLTYVSIVLYRWMHVHFMKKSATSGGAYFIYLWIENLVIIGVAQFLFKLFKLPRHSFMKNFSSLYPLFTLNVLVVVVQSYDFVSFTRKSGGTEFYQFTLVLVVPALLAVLHTVTTYKSPWLVSSMVGICTLLKMSFLLQDREFNMSLGTLVGSIVFALLYASYLIGLKTDLQKYTALELIYSFAVMGVILLPVLVIQRGEITRGGISFKLVIASAMTGSVKLSMLYFIFVLLKHTDPMKTLVVLNAAFVPDHFVQALVYKLDCHISASKVCVLVLVDFIMGHVKKKNLEASPNEERDDWIRYSLMR